MSPQAKFVRDTVKARGIKTIGGVSTLSRRVKDPINGGFYTEYGRAGTICQGLTKEQVDVLRNDGLTVYKATVKLPDYHPGQYWIVER